MASDKTVGPTQAERIEGNSTAVEQVHIGARPESEASDVGDDDGSGHGHGSSIGMGALAFGAAAAGATYATTRLAAGMVEWVAPQSDIT